MGQNRIAAGSSFSELCRRTTDVLKGHWGIVIGSTFVVNLMIGMASQFVGALGNLLLSPLSVGLCLLMLRLIRQQSPLEIGVLFEPFSDYGRYFWATLRCAIFVFLWALLLIIPGIVASYRYSMVYYIMLDHPEYSAKEAMEESSAIMYGHKFQLFGYLFLLGLVVVLVAFCTLLIGLIWLVPWIAVFQAAFYESIKRPPVSPDSDPEPGTEAETDVETEAPAEA